MADKTPKKHETLHALAYLSNIGFTMAAIVFVGVMIGRFLDRKLGTEPWLLLVFALLGVGAAIKALFDISKEKFTDLTKANNEEANNGKDNDMDDS